MLLRGAVMAFQHDHGMSPTANIGAKFWAALFKAAQAGDMNAAGYTYALASKTLPESLTIWHNGHEVFHSLANTGIPVAPTVDGTFPVYDKLPVPDHVAAPTRTAATTPTRSSGCPTSTAATPCTTSPGPATATSRAWAAWSCPDHRARRLPVAHLRQPGHRGHRDQLAAGAVRCAARSRALAGPGSGMPGAGPEAAPAHRHPVRHLTRLAGPFIRKSGTFVTSAPGAQVLSAVRRCVRFLTNPQVVLAKGARSGVRESPGIPLGM